MKTDVLVAGAGPTGLMLAVWLQRKGIPHIVIDKKDGTGHQSRALGVQSRSMETYDMLGIGERACELGIHALAVNMWLNGKLVRRVPFADMGGGWSPHPYMHVLGQDKNEEILFEHLREHGGDVLWNTELAGFTQDADGVRAKTADGREIEARYICGCDGAHSAVRHQLGLEFPGGMYPRTFFVADVRAGGSLRDGELNLAVQPDGFQAYFPMPGPGRFRIVGFVPAAVRDKRDLNFEDVRGETESLFSVKVDEVFWFSPYRVHHRVASRFQDGRAFIAGDAGHIHSPVGGQGMNTGLMDATNLGWKLAAVCKGAPPTLLETYPVERVPFARALISTTDKLFNLITSHSPAARVFRGLVFPGFFSLFTRFAWVRRQSFKLISQTWVHYRNSPLSRGLAGAVRAGDRLPWVESLDNFKPLQSLDWQVHIYGDGPQLETRLPVHRFASARPFMDGAAYVIRPDGYVGLAQERPDASEIESYLARWT